MNAALKNIFRALKYRNYRLFFAGQSVSLIGTWIQAIASGWLVYRITNSASLLGVVAFSSQIPSFLLASFAGVMVDRWNRHRLLVITQTLAMLQAFVLAGLVLSGAITVWQIIFLNLILGLINAFDMPARQSFVVEMIEKKEDLGNAIALNSSIVNSARLIGPAAAGVLIAAFGEGFCFLLNGISFLAVIFSLLAMKVAPRIQKAGKTDLFKELKEGFRYVYHFSPIRDILLLMALVSLVGMPYAVLMPIFARDILHGGPQALGFLMAASGIGALVGALYLASRKNVVGLGRIMALGAFVFGVGLMAFSFSQLFWLSLSVMLFAGFGMMTQIAASNTLVQTLVADDKRGRVMSMYTMAFMGMAPFGSLLAGTLAHNLGAPQTLFLCGLACIGGAFLFSARLPHLRRIIRPIYVEMGILSASELTTPPEEI